jgi:hypothetical protein
MKYVISLMLILTPLVLKADPIHIFYETNNDLAYEVKKIFTEQYSIPEEIISIKQISNCQQITGEGKLDLCINENGDLQVVSADQRFISDSLKVFKAPKGHL